MSGGLGGGAVGELSQRFVRWCNGQEIRLMSGGQNLTSAVISNTAPRELQPALNHDQTVER